jgi:hypothetical protein
MQMVFAFDTLGYSKRLRDAGIPDGHADAHAEAARQFIMTELAIKSDMLELKSEMFALKSEVASLRDSVAMKSDLQAIRNELYAAIEKSALQTTIRLGGVVAVGVGILAALQRIH